MGTYDFALLAKLVREPDPRHRPIAGSADCIAAAPAGLAWPTAPTATARSGTVPGGEPSGAALPRCASEARDRIEAADRFDHLSGRCEVRCRVVRATREYLHVDLTRFRHSFDPQSPGRIQTTDLGRCDEKQGRDGPGEPKEDGTGAPIRNKRLCADPKGECDHRRED